MAVIGLVGPDPYCVFGPYGEDPDQVVARWIGMPLGKEYAHRRGFSEPNEDGMPSVHTALADFSPLTQIRLDRGPISGQRVRAAERQWDRARPALFAADVELPSPAPVLDALRSVLTERAPDGWQRITLECRALVHEMELITRVVGADGEERFWSPPPQVSQWLRRLRLVTYHPDRGAWFTARYEIARDAEPRIEFDHDAEPDWLFPHVRGNRTPAAAYLDELWLLPRAVDATPDWMIREIYRDRLNETWSLVTAPATAAQPRDLRRAPLFDVVGEDGTLPRNYRPVLGNHERQAVLKYLRDAPVVLSSRGQTEDDLDPERGRVVPMAYQTDGAWIWSAAHAYYLEHHGLTPPLELLGHIRDRRYQLPERVPENAKNRASALAMGMPDANSAIQEDLGRTYWWIRWYARHHDLCPAAYAVGVAAPNAWCLVPENDEYAVFWNGEERQYEARFPNIWEAANYLLGTLVANAADLRRHPEDIYDDYDCPIPVLGDDPPLAHYANKLLVQLTEGFEVDRHGGPEGNTTFAVGTPFEQRSLPPEWAQREYHRYRLVKNGLVISGATEGGATAYLFPQSITEHLAAGHLVEIDPNAPAPAEVPPPPPPATD
ncbi:TNT domain-containing protein [Streptoalloteichus tenebrarius]|uniref:TNT domain-containing protein n=1 Tax=Streptoalloteichus tenebrarius (strain ATCC 17920 / DSM 40477 / JCM 4838 / CBS 697.72 / NBRC 16177 / NCIMB 11028 / NRRL B-12390 / A12253. 1 / ISP 5477) TaxID=1933 RepID=UPI0020A271BE|nr:TNT domain-containing protein [Streptoalloteichus tenebrarius]